MAVREARPAHLSSALSHSLALSPSCAIHYLRPDPGLRLRPPSLILSPFSLSRPTELLPPLSRALASPPVPSLYRSRAPLQLSPGFILSPALPGFPVTCPSPPPYASRSPLNPLRLPSQISDNPCKIRVLPVASHSNSSPVFIP